MPARPRDHPFFWMILALGAVVFAFLAFVAAMAVRVGPVTKDLGWSAKLHDSVVRVAEVNAEGPAAGQLAPRDRVLTVDGDSRGIGLRLWLIRPQRSYVLRIARDGMEHEFTLMARTRRDSGWLWVELSIVPYALSLYIVGLLVGLLKPEQRPARLMAVSCVLLAPREIAYAFPSDLLNGWPRVAMIMAASLGSLPHAVAYQFYLAFPTGARRGRGTRLLTAVFYIGGVFCCVCWLLAATPLAPHLSRVFGAWSLTSSLLIPATLVAIGVAIVQSLRASLDRDQHRRVSWVLFGSAVALLPRAAVLVFFISAGALGYQTPFLGPSLLVMNVLMLAIPITLFYAVAKRRLFDISLVLRRGVQYLLARNILRVALLLPVVLLAGGVLSHPERTVGEIFFAHPGYLLLMAASGVSLRSRERLTAWVDRRFFRDAHAQEQILHALIQDVGSQNSLAALAALVGHRLEDALHPDGVHLLFRDSARSEFSPGYSSHEHPKVLRIVETAPLAQRASEATGSVDLSSIDGTDMPDAQGARLLVPIRTGDERLVGLLLLGSKRSEEPYSRKERNLLEALSVQIAIVYENDSLRKRLAEGERVQREVLAHLDREGVNLLKECPRCGLCYDKSAAICERDREPLTFTLPIQRTIDGRYRLERLVGRGGMGAVYEAKDVRLDRAVAIKILRGNSFGDRNALRRFKSEALALARLRHANIVAVHDFGEIDPLGAYIVMELLRGVNLRSELQSRGGLPPRVVAEWFDQIFEGVKAAHRSAIVHRDLKPENVFVSQDEGRTRVHILDFGLAKLLRPEGSNSASLTGAGVVMGTRSYMSPEQLRGQEIDERTDVFSLGVMIVECLTGENPFRERGAGDATPEQVSRPLRLRDEEAIQTLNTALGRCLALERGARFPTVAAMQEALVPLIRDCPPFSAAGGPGADVETSVV
jgi:tRNA A-37 threonylcarbamoyl transferase component Bud32/GAF domain-containing protein